MKSRALRWRHCRCADAIDVLGLKRVLQADVELPRQCAGITRSSAFRGNDTTRLFGRR